MLDKVRALVNNRCENADIECLTERRRVLQDRCYEGYYRININK